MFEPIDTKISAETGYALKKVRPIGYLYQGSKSWMLLSPPKYSNVLQHWTAPICYGYLSKDATIYVQEGLWLSGSWAVRFCETLQEKNVWVFQEVEE